MDLAVEANPPNKCLLHQLLHAPGVVSLPSVGYGGEGAARGSVRVVGSTRWSRENEAQVLSCVSKDGLCDRVDQQRPDVADAILGQGRPSAPDCDVGLLLP
jgi:hypothetical protein